MSKRFGRRQKRKMREQIGGLEKQVENLQLEFQKLNYLKRVLQEIEDAIREIFGKYTAYLPPQDMAWHGYPPETLELPVMHSSRIGMIPDADMPINRVSYIKAMLHRLGVKVERSDLQRAMHLRLHVQNNGVFYYMDDMALAQGGINVAKAMSETVVETLLRCSQLQEKPTDVVVPVLP